MPMGKLVYLVWKVVTPSNTSGYPDGFYPVGLFDSFTET